MIDRFVSLPSDRGGTISVDVTRVVTITPSRTRHYRCHVQLDTGDVLTVDQEMDEVVRMLNRAAR